MERKKNKQISHWVTFFENTRISSGTWGDAFRGPAPPSKFPEAFNHTSSAIRAEVIYRIKYRGYLARELRQVEKLAHVDKISIPAALDYERVPGLKRESTVKLAQIRPATLGQAGRISGVSPADISILMIFIESGRASGLNPS